MNIRLFPYRVKLMLLFLAVVLIAIVPIGIQQYYYHKNVVDEEFDVKKRLLEDRVFDYVRYIDQKYLVLEEKLNQRAKGILEMVSSRYEEIGNISFDLNELVNYYPDTDIYIIDEKNIICKTTDNSDLGLDFNDYPKFINSLNNIRYSKSFVFDRMEVSVVEKTLKKYCYYPSHDNKYIFEVGIHMSDLNFSLGDESFSKLEKEIIESNNFVDHVTLFNRSGVSYIEDEQGQMVNIRPDHHLYLSQAIDTFETVEVDDIYNGHSVVYRYVPYRIIGAMGSNDINAIQIIYNKNWIQDSNQKNLVTLLSITLLIMIATFIIAVYSSNSITQPISAMVNAIKNISEGDMSARTNIKANDEFSILSSSFDNMIDEIQILIEDKTKNEKDLHIKKEEIEALYEETVAINSELGHYLSLNQKSHFETVTALASAIEAKDQYTGGHCERVMKYSLAIAKQIDLSDTQLDDLMFGSMLHDIGKIGIPEEILNKKGLYNDEEYNSMKLHPEIGYKILSGIEFFANSSKIAYSHHERYDGKGYPLSLKGDDIDILARIVSVADAFDAMTSSRPYRDKHLSPEEALSELARCKWTQFDGNIVDVFTDVLSTNEDNIKNLVGN